MQEMQELRFHLWVRTILWSRKEQSMPVFLPGKFHGQRSLAGYSAWSPKELDMNEQLSMHKIGTQIKIKFIPI